VAQGAERVAQVADECIDEGDGVHAVNLLLHQRGVAEFAARGEAGFVFQDPAGDVIFGLDLDIGLDLLAPLPIPLLPT
jgi:hypothetical protein